MLIPKVLRFVPVVAALMLGGCCQSIVPWWVKSRNVDVPGMVGRWEGPPVVKGKRDLYDISRIQPGMYRLIDLRHRDQPPAALSFARMDGYLLEDITCETPPAYTLPVHLVAVVWLNGGTMNCRVLGDDEMQGAIRKYGFRHYDSEDTTTLLETDSTKLTEALSYALKKKPLPPADTACHRVGHGLLFFHRDN